MFLRIIVVLLVVIGLSGVGLGLVAVLRPAPGPQVTVLASPGAPAPATVTKQQVLVAARPLRAGIMLTLDDLGAADVSIAAGSVGSYADTVATRTALRGAMVRRSLAANEPIMAGDVLSPGDRGFLAAVLGAGMRGVTVAVDPVSGTAGLIWPGDRVDLLLTQAIDEKEQPLDRRIVGETVLSNVRVIAVDQQLIQGGQGSNVNAGTTPNRTVTLEASPYDAERIMVAARLGKLSLVVRSATGDQGVTGVGAAKGDEALPSPRNPIAWSGDVSPALRDRPVGKSGVAIRVHRGTKDAEEVKF
jgi:pilus assembly protein CpaB